MSNKLSQYVSKIVVNSGIGRLTNTPTFAEKVLPEIMKDFATVTGQKPATRVAKQSIAGFKIREGVTVGLKATLRRKMMEDFFHKLIRVVFPRIRDFRGIPLKNVDQNGNLTIGVKEHITFPEINLELTKVNFGLQATIVLKDAKSREAAIQTYKELGVPFKK